MKKLLITLLVLFVLVDIFLAFVFFGPKSVTSPILKALPKNCKVVDSKYCDKATIVGNEKLNGTVIAFFDLPKGGKVYSPVNGTLNFERINPGNLPFHSVKGDDGVIYYFVFEPDRQPSRRTIKAGEVIGTATGLSISVMKNHTLGISTVKNVRYDKESFNLLFR